VTNRGRTLGEKAIEEGAREKTTKISLRNVRNLTGDPTPHSGKTVSRALIDFILLETRSSVSGFYGLGEGQEKEELRKCTSV